MLLGEAERILNSDRLRRRHQLDDASIERFMRGIESLSRFAIVAVGRPPIVVGDPHDDHVVYAAEQAGADAICTRDRHLFEPTVVSYCAQREIRVLGDLELLPELRGGNASGP